MEKITKDMLIGDILNVFPDAVKYLLEMGMFCVGCPASQGETLEQACMVHGIDADDMVQKLNEEFTAASKKSD
jgi:hybrid cluster-associated redox disulfide protein